MCFCSGAELLNILFADKQEDIMKIILYIAAVVFAISAGFFFASFFGAIGARRWKKYAQKSTATLIQVTKSYKRGASQWYEIEYTCDGILHTVMVAQKYVEGVSTETPAGTRVPIWYDPKKPEWVIIAEDLSMAEPVKSWKRTRKRSLIWMIISVGIMMFVLAREEELPELSLTATTIGQFSQEISALADKTPTALVYTESIGSPETFSAMVDDPAIAKEALDIILSAAVDKRGFYMDMYQLQYEEYRFVFDEETYTFGFVPKSYFCYGGKYYELGENRLAKVRNTLHGDQP